MALIAYRAAGLDKQLLRQSAESIGKIDEVDDPILSPATFLIHGPLADTVNEMLEVLAQFAFRDENTVGGCSDDKIFGSDADNGQFKFVDYIGVVGRLFMDVAVCVYVKLIGQRVPCAEIFPLAGVRYHSNRCRFLNHGVVEAYFRQIAVAFSQSREIGMGFHGFSDGHKVAKAESKYATVPQCPLGDQPFGSRHVGLLGEASYRHSGMSNAL